MKEIEVSAVLDAPRAEVERKLSPRSIVDYAGTYTVQSAEESDGTTILNVAGENVEAVLEFTEFDAGYVYSQRRENGPFEEMHTSITVDENGGTRVTVHSEFTFGGLFSVLTDWLGTRIRRDEMERLLANLAQDLEDGTDTERDPGGEP